MTATLENPTIHVNLVDDSGPEKIIRIIGAMGIVHRQDPDAQPGQWIRSFDPDAYDGRGDLATTEDPALALRFPDAVTAWRFWRQQSTVRPLRPDGKPNRPLTALSIMVEDAP